MEHGRKMGDFYFNNNKEIECPECGKMFRPAVQHSYYAGGNKSKLVCSYRCMREWDKKHPTKRNYASSKKEG